jgi:hypothetical protein
VSDVRPFTHRENASKTMKNKKGRWDRQNKKKHEPNIGLASVNHDEREIGLSRRHETNTAHETLQLLRDCWIGNPVISNRIILGGRVCEEEIFYFKFKKKRKRSKRKRGKKSHRVLATRVGAVLLFLLLLETISSLALG